MILRPTQKLRFDLGLASCHDVNEGVSWEATQLLFALFLF